MFEPMRHITGNRYVISTMLRDSSAALAPGKYYETMVFDNNDLIDEKYPRIVDQTEAGIEEVAMKNHRDMLAKYAGKDQCLTSTK